MSTKKSTVKILFCHTCKTNNPHDEVLDWGAWVCRKCGTAHTKAKKNNTV